MESLVLCGVSYCSPTDQRLVNELSRDCIKKFSHECVCLCVCFFLRAVEKFACTIVTLITARILHSPIPQKTQTKLLLLLTVYRGRKKAQNFPKDIFFLVGLFSVIFKMNQKF